MAAMAALQWFLIGVVVSWLPSLVFLGCIALGAAPEGRQRQQNLRMNPRQQNA